MRKIFEVELNSPDCDAYAALTLPALPHAMLDALERLGLAEGQLPQWRITRAYGDRNPFSLTRMEGTLLWLINKLAPARYARFVDVFGGSGTVTLGRPLRRGCIEIYNDFNSNLTNLFCCVKERTMALLRETVCTVGRTMVYWPQRKQGGDSHVRKEKSRPQQDVEDSR